jgi:UDP-galactopyranose mutase
MRNGNGFHLDKGGLPKWTDGDGRPIEWPSKRVLTVILALSAWAFSTLSMNLNIQTLTNVKSDTSQRIVKEVVKEIMTGDDEDDENASFKKYYVEIGDSSENVLPPGTENYSNTLDFEKKYDVCAIGAGLSGTVFAERSANVLEQNVLVIDSRPHIGGNCYDFHDQKTGILRNQYGSHLFHTNIKRVWNYVTGNPKAPKWKSWYHAKFGLVNGMYVPIPVNTQTVNRLLDLNIQTKDEMEEWLKSVQIPCPTSGCENAEQMAKSRVGSVLYKLIFEGYTIKQWGKSPKELKASVTARIPVFSTFDPRYFADKYQALPGDGYTAWFEAQLDHPLIDVVLNTDFFDHREHLESACEKIIYTGPIDRYFEEEGMEKLEYRSITFTEERHYNHPGYMLPTPVLNYPGLETEYTRAVEYKQYLHRPSNHTLVVKETTSHDGEPYYPVPTTRNQELYAKYQILSSKLEEEGKILFVGRLANYKYFNMDQAIGKSCASLC